MPACSACCRGLSHGSLQPAMVVPRDRSGRYSGVVMTVPPSERSDLRPRTTTWHISPHVPRIAPDITRDHLSGQTGSLLASAASYELSDVNWDSATVANPRRSDFIAVRYARRFDAPNFVMAIDARMPMISTTTSNTIIVKPMRRRNRAAMIRFLRSGQVFGTTWTDRCPACRPHGSCFLLRFAAPIGYMRARWLRAWARPACGR